MPKRIFGVLFFFGAVAAGVLENYVLAPVFMGISVVALALVSGLELDFEKLLYRDYTRIFYAWYSDPKSLKAYSAIVVLRKDGKQTLGTTNMRFASEISVYEYQVFLTDKNHRKRLYLAHFDTRDSADSYANRISEQIGFPYVAYSPVISEDTLRRRR